MIPVKSIKLPQIKKMIFFLFKKTKGVCCSVRQREGVTQLKYYVEIFRTATSVSRNRVHVALNNLHDTPSTVFIRTTLQPKKSIQFVVFF